MSICAPMKDIEVELQGRIDINNFLGEYYLDWGTFLCEPGRLIFIRWALHLGDGELEPEFFIAIPESLYSIENITQLNTILQNYIWTVGVHQLPNFCYELQQISIRNRGNWFNCIIGDLLNTKIVEIIELHNS
jgi:hypothetical protein